MRAQPRKVLGPSAPEVPIDTGGTVPGNAARTVALTERLYQCIRVFRSRHGGQCPQYLELVEDMEANPDYPWNLRALETPDCRYANRASMRGAVPCFPFVLVTERPDGSDFGTPKQRGKRDLLAYCDLYFHENIRANPRNQHLGSTFCCGKTER